jgi:hypothetical protein
MIEKNSAIIKKHELHSSNVDVTKSILNEYRMLKKEETNLRQADLKENIEREKERVNGIKKQILSRESLKS